MTLYFSVNFPDINAIKQRNVRRTFLNLFISNIYFRFSESLNFSSRNNNCMLLFDCFEDELFLN
jgi:hypothetical protein